MKNSKLYCCFSLPLREFLTEHNIRYEICAVNVVPADGAEIVLDFDNEDEMNRYMERVKEESIFYRDIKAEDIVEEEGISSLITMVTCSYEFDDARTLVSAALKPVQ